MTADFLLGFQAGLAVAAVVLVLLGTCYVARRLQEAAALCDRLLDECTERGATVKDNDSQRVRHIGLPLPPDDRVVMVRGMMLPLYEN